MSDNSNNVRNVAQLTAQNHSFFYALEYSSFSNTFQIKSVEVNEIYVL